VPRAVVARAGEHRRTAGGAAARAACESVCGRTRAGGGGGRACVRRRARSARPRVLAGAAARLRLTCVGQARVTSVGLRGLTAQGEACVEKGRGIGVASASSRSRLVVRAALRLREERRKKLPAVRAALWCCACCLVAERRKEEEEKGGRSCLLWCCSGWVRGGAISVQSVICSVLEKKVCRSALLWRRRCGDLLSCGNLVVEAHSD
jgi:hypothetical protein